MLLYAETQFEDQRTDSSGKVSRGATKRQLQNSAFATDKLKEEVAGDPADEPELPLDLIYLWNIFRELHSRRRSGFGGPEAIGDDGVYYWEQSNGPLMVWERDVIHDIDLLYRVIMAREDNEKKPDG